MDVESFSTVQVKRHDNGEDIVVLSVQVAASLRYVVTLTLYCCYTNSVACFDRNKE